MVVDGSEEWHEQRAKGIGGSDAAVIMEVSPWKSKLELWVEKVQGIRKEFKSNDLMKWGKILEIPIIDEYRKDSGREVIIDEDLCHFSHPIHDFMIGNTDGIITDENKIGNGILEVKVKNVYTKWEPDWKTGNIPIYYKIQMQHYLNISKCLWGSFAVLDLSAMELVWFDVERDDDLANMLIEKEIDFWDMVTNKIRPEPDDSKSCSDFLRNYYPESVKDTVINLTGDEEAIRQSDTLIHAKKLAKSVKESEMGAKNWFMDMMGDNEKAIGDDFSISWKSMGNKESFDIKSFKDKHPELYYEFTSMKPQTRRFSFREKTN